MTTAPDCAADCGGTGVDEFCHVEAVSRKMKISANQKHDHESDVAGLPSDGWKNEFCMSQEDRPGLLEAETTVVKLELLGRILISTSGLSEKICC